MYFLFGEASLFFAQFTEQISHFLDAVSNALANMSIGSSDSISFFDFLILIDLVPALEKLGLKEVEFRGGERTF